ncbi:MAG: GAP family protein [bacterium]
MMQNLFEKAYAATSNTCQSSRFWECSDMVSQNFNFSLTTFWIITSAALVDSINPCAIAVLLILLGSLLVTKDRKQVLKTGLLFCLGLFIAYFLAGLGLFSVFSFFELQRYAEYIHWVIGGLAIFLGLFNIKDFFWYGKGAAMEIPNSWRPTMRKFLQSIASPIGAFLAGFVIILFELPCTGGPYLFTVGYLSTLSKVVVIPILIYYNLLFILPLLIIIGLIYLGRSSVESTKKWKNRNIRVLHLIAGLILLGLGIWVIT